MYEALKPPKPLNINKVEVVEITIILTSFCPRPSSPLLPIKIPQYDTEPITRP